MFDFFINEMLPSNTFLQVATLFKLKYAVLVKTRWNGYFTPADKNMPWYNLSERQFGSIFQEP